MKQLQWESCGTKGSTTPDCPYAMMHTQQTFDDETKTERVPCCNHPSLLMRPVRLGKGRFPGMPPAFCPVPDKGFDIGDLHVPQIPDGATIQLTTSWRDEETGEMRKKVTNITNIMHDAHSAPVLTDAGDLDSP